MNLLSGDLGPTLTYTRREYRWPDGCGWPDGREGTLWLELWSAKRRRNVKTVLARYAIGEIRKIGFMGRAFMFDKEFPENEHDSADRDNVRKPPYLVTIDHHGSPSCQCMADACHAPSCRHIDAVLVLLDEGAFQNSQLQGA